MSRIRISGTTIRMALVPCAKRTRSVVHSIPNQWPASFVQSSAARDTRAGETAQAHPTRCLTQPRARTKCFAALMGLDLITRILSPQPAIQFSLEEAWHSRVRSSTLSARAQVSRTASFPKRRLDDLPASTTLKACPEDSTAASKSRPQPSEPCSKPSGRNPSGSLASSGAPSRRLP